MTWDGRQPCPNGWTALPAGRMSLCGMCGGQSAFTLEGEPLAPIIHVPGCQNDTGSAPIDCGGQPIDRAFFRVGSPDSDWIGSWDRFDDWVKRVG